MARRRLGRLGPLAVMVLLALPPTPAAAAGTDVQVNGDASGTVQNEPRITQNPANPANLLVAYNDTLGAASARMRVAVTDVGPARAEGVSLERLTYVRLSSLTPSPLTRNMSPHRPQPSIDFSRLARSSRTS